MCGIAGRILQGYAQVGSDLVELMAAQEHRGADSTGFAIYGTPREDGYIIRAMGFDRSQIDRDMAKLRDVLKAHGADFIEDPTFDNEKTKHYSMRVVISDPKDIPSFVYDADLNSKELEIQSMGRSLEIIKDVGGARDVDAKHGISQMVGSHGLGHARLATESDVRPNASHPFWARPFPDVSIVHNGQITNYYKWRETLMRQGYRFMTENDSELIAVWVSDQIKQGLTTEEALEKSITSIDGVFTFMIAKPDGIAFAKDRFAMKPLVVIDQNGELCAATEEQAVRRLITEECDVINYDGPSLYGEWGVGNRSLSA